MNFSEVTRKRLEKKNDEFCMYYEMLFPFTGAFNVCEKTTTPSGEIGLHSGLLEWNKARSLGSNEIVKQLSSQSMILNTWPSVKIVFKKKDKGIHAGKYYWGTTYRGYEKGHESNFAARIYMSGEVEFKEFPSTHTISFEEITSFENN